MFISSTRAVSNVVIALGLGMAVWVIGLFGFVSYARYNHERARTFELEHLYRPLSGSYQQVALHARGDIEASGDNVVPSSQVVIAITINDGQTFAKALQFSDDNLLAGDKSYVRVSATPERLATWLTSLPIELEKDSLHAEAAELSLWVSVACRAYSPKTDLRYFAWVRPE